MKPADLCCLYPMFHFLMKILLLTLLIFIYCEFILYYLVLLGCSWPQLSKLDQDFTIEPPKDASGKPLHVMLVADPHLLAAHEGHWFDKHRREWQLYRSFQSALFLFEPHVIFVLGDLTDQGQRHSDQQWNKTILRFRSIFDTPENIRLYVLPGNHDIGFHYEVTDGHLKRFAQSFHTSDVQLVTVEKDNIHFVLINSMAFEGDQCRLCERAEHQFNDIVERLSEINPKTRPVLLSHFPLYRTSDTKCLRRSSTLLKVSSADSSLSIHCLFHSSLLPYQPPTKNVRMFSPKKQRIIS